MSPLQGSEYCANLTRAFSPGFNITGFQPCDLNGDFLDFGIRDGSGFRRSDFDFVQISGEPRLKKG